MNETEKETEQWRRLFEVVFQKAKEHLLNHYTLEEDGSGHPRVVAMRKVIEQLPCAVKVLELEIDRGKYKHLTNDLCPLVSYDFSRMNNLSVQYLGRVSPRDKKFKEILRNEFHIKDTEGFIQQFEDYRISGYWEEDLSGNIQLLFYDPRKDLNQFVYDFIILFDFDYAPVLAGRIKMDVDYNEVYGLKPDPILSEAELLTKYVGMNSFVRLDKEQSRSITVEDLQRDVAHIQLIPNVNEHTRRVFDRAKKLYIFAWYVYDFFPVSHHYAALALESAIKHRYYAHFGGNVKIVNKLGKEAVMSVFDHAKILEFCKRNKKDGWDVGSLKVNEEKFAYGIHDLLDWLVKNKFITSWERRMYENILWSRNYLSHQTFSPIYPASWPLTAIRDVAYLINKMFSSLNTNSQST